VHLAGDRRDLGAGADRGARRGDGDDARALAQQLVVLPARQLAGLDIDLRGAQPAAQREARQIDEQLFFETFTPPTAVAAPLKVAAGAGRRR
jgi:hypothetical protein